MFLHLGLALAVSAAAAPANEQSDLEAGFSGALKGCEEWVLNPASWAEGFAPFVATVGLGDRMGLVEAIEEVLLPPKKFQVANHYWRINSTEDAGYMLVVSDRLPMCHITGGGRQDLQPVVEAVLAGSQFRSGWGKVRDLSRGDIVSTEYRNREEKSFSLVVSRAKEPGQRLDQVQVIATAIYSPVG